MTTPTRSPLFKRRNAVPDIRPAMERHEYSPSVSYSSDSKSRKNPVTATARSIAGAFVNCFAPRESNTDTAKHAVDSDDSRALSESTGYDGQRRRSSRQSNDGQRRRSSSQIGYVSSGSPAQRRESGTSRFTMEEIFKATRNFSPAFKIGQGGFGAVYKGRLEDGSILAIKRAKKSVYDKHLGVEFESEVRTLAQVEHLNLVRFYGYLEHGDERIVLVEYVPNGTLREHLDCEHGKVLDLAGRLDIAIDVAHAITYLHMYTDHPIIHRDIKSSNILLTEKFRAKVADFGFARLAADTESGATHVSTQVKGTAGYLDPEYLKTYQLTEKSDVYSFGVLLVELVTGRRPIETKRELKERITTRWAMRQFTEGDAISTLDPKLEENAGSILAVEKILELSLQCMAPRRQNRPSMRRCGEILWSIRKDYKEQSAIDFRSLSSSSEMGASVRE